MDHAGNISEWNAGPLRATLTGTTLLLQLPIVQIEGDEFTYWGDRVIPFDPSTGSEDHRLLGT